MKRSLSALIIAIGLAAGPVMAQEATMEVGLSMLELSVGKSLSKYGIQGVDPMSLSLGQLGEIKAIVSSSDWGRDEKQKAIKATIANR